MIERSERNYELNQFCGLKRHEMSFRTSLNNLLKLLLFGYANEILRAKYQLDTLHDKQYNTYIKQRAGNINVSILRSAKTKDYSSSS